MPVETDLAEHTGYPRHQAYVLRLWQERPGDPWRVRLQAAGEDTPQGFADPNTCFDFIRAQLAEEGKKESNNS
ncbi:MAG: hypothetical protein JXR84_22495 [Anaerolineae bacterium]|nr:hypothetical protein [Anaerolineae bacterium]